MSDPPVFVNSYAWMMRNVILDRLKLVPPFSTDVVKFSRQNARPIQAEQIPYLGVYLMPDDEAEQDGAGNLTEPHFLHKITLGFSYIVQNNDPEAAEELIDCGHWSIMKLLHDPNWNKWPAEMNMTYPMIEAVIAVARRPVFGTIGKDNETPVAEMQMEWVVTQRTRFEPRVSDIFESVLFKSVYPYPEDPNRQPIIAEWIMETTTARARKLKQED